MESLKKTMVYVVGATAIAATSAYLAMPKATRDSIKDTVKCMMKKEKKMVNNMVSMD